MRRTCQRHARGLSRSSVLRYIYWKMKDNSIAFYQHSTCLPSPNSSLVGQDVNSYSTLMDTLSDNTLTLSKKTLYHVAIPTDAAGLQRMTKKTHTHEADIAAPERQEVLVSLKRKAADQPLSATQNLLSEALVETSPAVNQILPNIMSLARVIQRSRATASGSSQHSIQYSVFSIQYSVFSIQYSVFSIQYSVFSIQYSVFSIQYSVFSIQYSVFSIQYSVFSMCIDLLI